MLECGYRGPVLSGPPVNHFVLLVTLCLLFRRRLHLLFVDSAVARYDSALNMIYFPDLGSTPPTSTLTLLLTRSPLVGNSYRCTDSPPSWRFLMVALSCFLFRTVAATIAYFPFPLSSATTQAQTPIDNPKHNTHTLECDDLLG
ncbi:hypothetical protein GLYMA_12G028600v4 [Glycine max]|nr:hypothetical protein GLYMA_12G028600v4 [Glycine max]